MVRKRQQKCCNKKVQQKYEKLIKLAFERSVSASRNCEGSYVLRGHSTVLELARQNSLALPKNDSETSAHRNPSTFLFVVPDLDVRVHLPFY